VLGVPADALAFSGLDYRSPWSLLLSTSSSARPLTTERCRHRWRWPANVAFASRANDASCRGSRSRGGALLPHPRSLKVVPFPLAIRLDRDVSLLNLVGRGGWPMPSPRQRSRDTVAPAGADGWQLTGSGLRQSGAPGSSRASTGTRFTSFPTEMTASNSCRALRVCSRYSGTGYPQAGRWTSYLAGGVAI
jgi:hypothetical protein